jgi:hypothetical protein
VNGRISSGGDFELVRDITSNRVVFSLPPSSGCSTPRGIGRKLWIGEYVHPLAARERRSAYPLIGPTLQANLRVLVKWRKRPVGYVLHRPLKLLENLLRALVVQPAGDEFPMTHTVIDQPKALLCNGQAGA